MNTITFHLGYYSIRNLCRNSLAIGIATVNSYNYALPTRHYKMSILSSSNRKMIQNTSPDTPHISNDNLVCLEGGGNICKLAKILNAHYRFV